MKTPNNIREIREFMMRKEVVSVALIILFVVVSLSTMFMSPQLYQWSVPEGDIALKNIYAPYDFTYLWEVDEEKTQEAVNISRKAVPYVLLRKTGDEEKTFSDLKRFFDIVEKEKNSDIEPEYKIEGVKTGIEGEIADRHLKVFLQSSELEETRERTIDAARNIYDAGYIDKEDLDYLKKKKISTVALVNDNTGDRKETSLKKLLNEANLEEKLEEYVAREFPTKRKIHQAVIVLLKMNIRPDLTPSEDKTEADRKIAAKAVKPVYKKWEVKKNELIIEKGKRVNARNIAQLSQSRRFFRPGTTPTFFLGVISLFLLLGLIAVIYMSFVYKKRNFLQDTKDIAIILLNIREPCLGKLSIRVAIINPPPTWTITEKIT